MKTPDGIEDILAWCRAEGRRIASLDPLDRLGALQGRKAGREARRMMEALGTDIMDMNEDALECCRAFAEGAGEAAASPVLEFWLLREKTLAADAFAAGAYGVGAEATGDWRIDDWDGKPAAREDAA